jgi:hypothetical protein
VKEHDLHGGDSAQLLLKYLNEVFSGKWTPDAIHSIVAICLHDKRDYPVDITRDPYSTLLIICDELQEWGRYIKGRERTAEIDKLTFCLNHQTAETFSIVVTLSYPRGRNTEINNFDDEIKKKEKDINEKFYYRIKKLEIHVKCEAY